MRATRYAIAVIGALTLFVGTSAAASDPLTTGTNATLLQAHAELALQAGPPSDLPGPVPDFVGTILDTIGQFLNGVLDGALGPAVSDEAGNAAVLGSTEG